MNRKLIVSKTIFFIFIILFIIIFQKIFGSENTLIGVTIITAALMLLERNLTVAPLKYLLYITSFNIFLGLMAFIASINIFTAIPVNFITVFIIGFFLCYNFKSNVYIPFGLQYLFMLSVPISIEKLQIRIFSLIVGSIFIMLLQFICNKNKLKKTGEKIIDNIFNLILEKIKGLILDKKDINLDGKILEDIVKLKKLVYGSRKKEFYLTEGGRLKLNIGATFENINITIDNLIKISNDEYVKTQLDSSLNLLDKILKGKRNVESLRAIKNQIKEIFILKNTKIDCCIKKLQINLGILCDYFIELNNIKNYNNINEKFLIPKEFNPINIIKRNFKFKTLRFSFAFKVALNVTIAIFIMDYFKIYEGRWMTYTVFVLTQPYLENSKQKALERIEGTLVGGVIFIILFSIFKNQVIRSGIVMGAGYMDGYTKQYNKKMICTTVSALGVTSITSDIEKELLLRIFFVGLGVVLSLLINRFVMPYTLKDNNIELMNMSDCVIKKMFNEIKFNISKGVNIHTIENLFMIFAMIENKLNLNKLELQNKNSKEFFKIRKKLVNNVYETYILLQNNKISFEDFKNIIKNNHIVYEANLNF